MKLKVYVDRMSQPSRAILIFCKMNGIDFEEVQIDIAKRQHLSPEFKKINPMGQVPAIADGEFTLFESHAILIHLACAFPGVADHWSNKGVVAIYTQTLHFGRFYCTFRTPATFHQTATTGSGTTTR